MHDSTDRAKDLLGRVYEYFLSGLRQFRRQARRRVLHPPLGRAHTGRDAGALQGPGLRSLLRLGGMFVQSEKFIEEHGGRRHDIAIYGQEINHTTWRLAKMNLAVRGIDADIRWNNEGSFHRDEFPDLRPTSSSPIRRSTSRTGAGIACRRRALEVRHTARGQRQLRLAPAHLHHLAPRGTLAWCSPTAPCRRSSRRRRDQPGDDRRPTSLTAWSPCRGSSSTRRRSRPACGSWPATRPPG
jgi:type I restriction enzyme M protein